MARRAGIIGHPLAHSLSPVFQRAAFIAVGLETDYERWDTTPDDLPRRIDSLRAPDIIGANVTIPYKEAVVPLLDELMGTSGRVGAVNTIVNKAGRLHGFNTDGLGFVSALRKEISFEPRARRILLLGAGGAARGIAFALQECDAASIDIWNRTASRAERLASDVAAGSSAAIAATADVSALAGYDCIVNCTSIGMDGTGTESETPCDLSSARPGAVAVDIVYKPADTPFLREARAGGLGTLGGLPMLVYQGALAFELWTGHDAPFETMMQAAENALAEERRGRNPVIVIGTVVTMAIFLFVGWLITTEMLQQLSWRKRVESGDGEIVVALCEEAISGWRAARPPRGVSAHLWASIQGAQLVAASPLQATVSTSAQGAFHTEGGKRIQESTDIQAAMAVAARLLDMLLYDVPNLRLSNVRVDVYGTFTALSGVPEQRPILTTTADRGTADSLEWEALSPDELLERFDTTIGQSDDGVAHAIDLPEVTGITAEEARLRMDAEASQGGA